MASLEKLILVFLIILVSLRLSFGSRYEFSKNNNNVGAISVEDFGAISDDETDNSEAFEKAWNASCAQGLVLVIPHRKTYYLKPLTFRGPCQFNTSLKIYGRMKAWGEMSAYDEVKRGRWIVFQGINNMTVNGYGTGTFDGNGQIWWDHSCKINPFLPCQPAPIAVTFSDCKNLKVQNLKMIDAQNVHMSFERCSNVEASHLNVTAPQNSPNTDGIHIGDTVNIHVHHCYIGTGDDCISIVTGSRNVTATNIICGPGHGISIGSLGAHNAEDKVSDVEVNGAIITGTLNGVRIKTWQGGSGYARNIKFKNVVMHNVYNPIIIDQSYCDQIEPCHDQGSAVAISDVEYKNIRGTSASEVAINFNCSKTAPCRAISVANVDLKLEGRNKANNNNGDAIASCRNVKFHRGVSFIPQCSPQLH